MKLSQQNLLDNEEKQKAGGQKNKTTINQMTGREASKLLLKNTSDKLQTFLSEENVKEKYSLV